MLRVSEYSRLLADLMCLDSEKIKKIRIGALYHDIGKMLIRNDILNKPSKLTIEEFEIIKNHSRLGLEILKDKYKEHTIENIILLHHEKWNGKGYPLGLERDKIPLEARIVSIVDCYDALTSKRVYRDKMPHEEALEVLKNESGQSFDPEMISMFEIFENNFKEILEKYDENERLYIKTDK